MVWLSHMATVEADAISYAWPPRYDAESQAEAVAFMDASERCFLAAKEANGGTLKNAFWQASLDAFHTADPSWFRKNDTETVDP
jgi:hypothetical protein